MPRWTIAGIVGAIAGVLGALIFSAFYPEVVIVKVVSPLVAAGAGAFGQWMEDRGKVNSAEEDTAANTESERRQHRRNEIEQGLEAQEPEPSGKGGKHGRRGEGGRETE